MVGVGGIVAQALVVTCEIGLYWAGREEGTTYFQAVGWGEVSVLTVARTCIESISRDSLVPGVREPCRRLWSTLWLVSLGR